MKKTQEVLNLPIISISDGMEVGRVKSLIINADKGAVDYIVVESEIQILNARVIPTDNIQGIGEYAVTVENDGAINDISKIPAAIDLLQKNIQVKGTKVLTKKGRLIGEIGDIYIDDEDDCKIIGLEYIADITQKRIRVIPRESVITFGKNLVVVKDDVESNLLDSATQLSSTGIPVEGEKKNQVVFENEPKIEYSSHKFRNPDTIGYNDVDACNEIASSREEYGLKNEGKYENKEDKTLEFTFNAFGNYNLPSENQEASNMEKSIGEEVNEEITQAQNLEENYTGYDNLVEENQIEEVDDMEQEETVKGIDLEDLQSEESSNAQLNSAGTFEQRQRQYLNGRICTKTINGYSGDVIITAGEIIDDEIIDSAKASGKLIELVMNNKA